MIPLWLIDLTTAKATIAATPMMGTLMTIGITDGTRGCAARKLTSG